MPPKILVAIAMMSVSLAAGASTLTGSTVAVSASSVDADVSFTPANASALIGSGIEFSTTFNFPYYTATINQDFSASALTISITSPDPGAIANSGGIFILTYTDAAFSSPFSLASFSCNHCDYGNGLISSTYSGTTETLKFNSIQTGETYNFNYLGATAVTPEPSSFLLLGTGLLAAAGALKRRLS